MVDTLEVINKYLIDISEEGDQNKRNEMNESMLAYLKGSEENLSILTLQKLFQIGNKLEKYTNERILEQSDLEFINELKKDVKDVTEHFKMFNLARRIPKGTN